MDADAGSSARLYVGNIPWSTTIDDLRELFAECGGVARVDIPTGRQGRSRGYGLVEFNSEAEAQAAVTRMDGTCDAMARRRRDRARSRGDRETRAEDGGRGTRAIEAGKTDGEMCGCVMRRYAAR